MTDETEVSARCAGCGEPPRLSNGYIVHMRSCPTLSEVEPAGSVPLPTPTPTEDREALRDRIAEALLNGDMSGMDIPDSEAKFWKRVADIAVMPVVDELRAEIEQLRAERAQIVAALDGFQLVDGDCGQPSGTLVQHVAALSGELATTREERDHLDLIMGEVRELADVDDKATDELVVHTLQERLSDASKKLLALDHPERPPWTPEDPWS